MYMKKKIQDESKEEIELTEEQKANDALPTQEPKVEFSIPWGSLIVIGVIIVLMIVCIIIIGVNGGF